jgi:hypothetical protein
MINRILGLSGTRGWILPHLWWGRVDHLLGVQHTLVWSGVLKNSWMQWFQILVVGPTEGQMVSEGPVSSWMPSSIGDQEFWGNDEYNVHTHYI